MAAISPMVVAFVVGITVSALSGSLPVMAPGNRFAAKTMLRFAVGLLGLQLTIHELAELGAVTLLVVLAVFIATFLFTKWLGRMLGVEHSLTELIAAGTSVCGASAIIATNAVTKARDQDVGYAVAAVSLLGSVAMIVYPLLYGVLHLDLRTYSLWAGSSVHEVAQVVAAAFQVDPSAGQIAVPVKLARVALLAPLVLTLGWLRFRREGDAARAVVSLATNLSALHGRLHRCSLRSTARSRFPPIGAAWSRRSPRFCSPCRSAPSGSRRACAICGIRVFGR